ncbi:uncharacterized protein LOC131007556 [Salvia miltiorrhiza]|uniref:uncharacterized protein LOC131007556 n=1 Tax=Salvia miltiorrhiza TaxID=226208 RepID=UPI0025ACA17C|nr:uncharacterized protein LOC131007556 [Salvia miltiorrhiza]
MDDSDEFGLCIYHGGKFATIGTSSRLYSGGELTSRYGLDRDRFGYLDLEEEVQKLGYVSWKCLAYKVPRTLVYMELSEDKHVMQMLKHISRSCRSISVYVDDGKREVVKAVTEVVTKTVTKTITTTKRSVGKGGGKSEKVKEKVDVGGQKVDKGKGKVEQGGEKGEVGDDVVSQYSQLTDAAEWSTDEDDDDYCPGEEDEELVESEDSLGDMELGSDDDEYEQARVNLREGLGVLGDNMSDNELSLEAENSDSCDSDGQLVRSKQPKVVYDPKMDIADLQLVLGMRFEDGFQCKKALVSWSIVKGHPIHFRRVNKEQCEAYCEEPCMWRVFASTVQKEKSLVVKVLGDDHTCTFAVENRQASYKWIGEQYIEVFRVRPQMMVEEFRNDVKRRFNIAIPNGRLYRAKAYALETLRGSVTGHYAKLRSYISELMRVDREGRFELLVGDGTIFKGLYIGFSALKKGFVEGCRPIIGLDGCFLKTHLGGQLLCAIGKDGNNQMYPIAWAVVEVENEACWAWFISMLLEELGVTDGSGYTFISDQQKGLTNAIKDLAPFAEHRNCARHVYMNWKKQFKGVTLKHMFWEGVRSSYKEEWDAAMDKLKAENMVAYENFIERDPSRFCKAFISTACVSDMVDNNVSETFNGYILNARGKHIIHMLEAVRSGLRERQFQKLKHVESVSDVLTPAVRKKVEKLKSLARFCTAHPGLGGKFEVENKDDRFIVSLPERNCSCRVWELTGIPCIHAISAIHFMKEDPANYVHKYLTTFFFW